MPRWVHSDPAVADVGMDEAAARATGREVRVGRGRFTEATPVLSIGDAPASGFIKLVADARTRRLLGGLIVGERLLVRVKLARGSTKSNGRV